jgi:hypothetical protein
LRYRGKARAPTRKDALETHSIIIRIGTVVLVVQNFRETLARKILVGPFDRQRSLR